MTRLIALIGGNEFRPDCEPMDRALLAQLAADPNVVILLTAARAREPSPGRRQRRALFPPPWRAGRGGAMAGSSAGAMICGGQMWAPGHGWREGRQCGLRE